MLPLTEIYKSTIKFIEISIQGVIVKNLIFLIFISIFITGCATKTNLNQGIIKSSDPIFITTPLNKKSTYVKFTNSSTLDSNLTQAIEFELAKNGFKIVSNEAKANIIIKGNLNYFRRLQIKDPNVFLNFGFGSGFRRAGWGMGFGMPFGDFDDDYYDYRTNSYIYDGQLSLLVRVRDGIKFNDYATNLNYQSDKNINSASTMNDIFNYKISKQILVYLTN